MRRKRKAISVDGKARPSSTTGSRPAIELSHAAADVFRSLPERDAQRVAVALKALTSRADRQPARGVSAQGFLEARAAGYRVLYRLDKRAIKVALLNRIDEARLREFPKP